MLDERWTEISPSQFDHEAKGLAYVKQLLPDAAPFRAWSNFEFRDERGRWHEVDLLVLTADTLYLIELKYYKGTLRGNDHVWQRSGYRSEDSPLLLARRKAQYFASLLKKRIVEKLGSSTAKLIPFVQELVFLHHPDMVCELPASSMINLYGFDENKRTSHLPGLSERLLSTRREPVVSEEHSLLIRDLIKAIGIAPRRQREVGSWIIDDEPLGDGDGWQDWPAFHHVDTERHGRIRFYLPKSGASSADQHAQNRAVENEFRQLKRLQHDGLQVPEDVVKDPELGIGLVFVQSKDDERLDLWLTDRKNELTLDQQLELVSEIAEIIQYAHRHRVVHRTLNPRAITIAQRANKKPRPHVTDWDTAGVLPANAESGITHLTPGAMSLMAGGLGDQARLFASPEDFKSTDPARLDVFGLGALAFYILTCGTLPATERGELMDRLRRDQGLDLAADMPQVPSTLRKWVLDATHPVPSQRTATIAELLGGLEAVRHELTGSESEFDPLDAGPGDELADGRFVYKRRLGAGSTAVGILVVDHNAVDAERVLKVARDDDAATRLHAEAGLLDKLNDPGIVRFYTEETIGGRAALVIQYAGSSTLAEELSTKGGRLSIDLLERWGTDLLKALVALERAGVMHRDIKPSNLGVFAASSRSDAHLVMFDFSMAGVDPRNIEAGSPPYLDPFLGSDGRRQYDTAAERYGAGVVLYEMATGTTPQYGPNADVNPATVDDDVTITLDAFDAAVADRLASFFSAALSRHARHRPDTAEDMLTAWRGVFTAVDETPQPTPTSDLKVNPETPLHSTGLGARARSALAAAHITTVGELLAFDSARLNRLVAKEAKATRAEIKERYRVWGKDPAVKPTRKRGSAGRSLLGLDDAVNTLLAAVGTGPTSTRRRAAESLLGIKGNLDPFVSANGLAVALDKSHQRGGQLIRELQSDWAEDRSARELLDGLIELANSVLAEYGGVVAISTLTAEIRGRVPQAPSAVADAAALARDERVAAGLLRVAYDRLAEHEAAEGTRQLIRRRHGGRLTLVATDELLLAGAERAAKRAAELVADTNRATLAATAEERVVPLGVAVRELKHAFTRAYRTASNDDAKVPLPSDSRLVRLAATVAGVGVSGRGELHALALTPTVALTLALKGLAQTEKLSATEVRDRVAARFPQLDRLPGRPHLDPIVERAGLGLSWDGTHYRYENAAPPSYTTLNTRQSTFPGTEPESDNAPVIPAAAVKAQSDILLISLRENGFVAIGVPIHRPGEHITVARRLAEDHKGQILDVTDTIVTAMREYATSKGVSWDLVRGADAVDAAPRDARGLRAVLDAVMPTVRQRIDRLVFDKTVVDDEPTTARGPLILTELSPLARYGYLDILAHLSDLSAPRQCPTWLVLPQLRGQRGALVDGKPIQLGSPGGQYVTWSPIPAPTSSDDDQQTSEAV